MKILITTDLYKETTNGVVISVKNLCRELTAKGYEVKVLTLSRDIHSHKENSEYYIRSVSIDFIYPKMRLALPYRSKHIKELIEWKPDIIHSQCEFCTYSSALKIAKKLEIPLIHTYHTLYEEYVNYVIPGKRLGKYLVRIFTKKRLKRADCVICPTKKVSDILYRYGLKNEIQVVPSGIDSEQHSKKISEAEKQLLKEKLGIPNNCKVVLSLGRLGTEKNIDELIRLFSIAVKLYGNMKLLIVGDGPAKSELETLAVQLDMKEHIIFTGMVYPSEVHRYYQLADIFVSASVSETQGLTYVEALANSTPLLCREDSCLDGVLKYGVNGFTYNDENGFCDRLLQMLDNEDWSKMAACESKKTSEQFSANSFATKVEEIYMTYSD